MPNHDLKMIWNALSELLIIEAKILARVAEIGEVLKNHKQAIDDLKAEHEVIHQGLAETLNLSTEIVSYLKESSSRTP